MPSTSENGCCKIGTRLGWVEQLGGGEWTTADQNSPNLRGPAVDLSGLHARLVIGIGAHNGW